MSEVNLIVKAGQLVPAHDQASIPKGAVAISGNRIVAIGTYDEFLRQYPNAKHIGGDRFLLIPGLINGHGHGKGLSDFQRGAIDNTLESWLLDTRKYIPVSVYDDVAFSAMRLLKSGVTTTMHNHVLKDPKAYQQEFEEAIKAYRDAGIRVQFNPGIRNENPFIYGDNAAFLNRLPKEVKERLITPPAPGSLTGENFVKVVTDLHARHDSPMCRIGFGPGAPQWCTRELLVDVKRAADKLGTPIHIHALQTIFQKIYGLERYGKTLIQYMNEIGFLGPRVVIGHCVWPTETDIDLLAKTGTGVTHHASTNLRVRNGISPVFEMLRAGVRVGLGIDSKSINDDDDIIQEMKVCFLLHRIPSLELNSPHLSARQVFQMVTETNASLLGYDRQLGRLEPGRLADLVLLDYQKMCFPFVDPTHDPVEVLLYRGKSSHVHTVMVDGRIVVEEGRVLTVNEEAIGSRLAEAASRPRTDKEEELARGLDELKKHLIKYYEGWSQKVETRPYFSINSRVDRLKRS
jgi:cytosine/adenosine deaminase-related metal-dependent hydrolase